MLYNLFYQILVSFKFISFSVHDLYLQICITTSTSASLEQILPWMYYHKVIGVSTFFLFVEGKAASPQVSKVLESIPVSLCPKVQMYFSSA